MSHAEMCPLCKGTGNKDGAPRLEAGTNIYCHGCGGTGWVTVTDSSDDIVYDYNWPIGLSRITENWPLDTAGMPIIPCTMQEF